LSRTNPENYRNAFQAIKTIFREEGIKGFKKGIGARIMWIAPGTAITISSYEQCKKFYLHLQESLL